MRTVAYTCPFVPAEWIAAHGLAARRVVPALAPPDGLLPPQAGMCPYARAFVNALARPPVPDAAVFTTVCDQMRRAAEWFAARSNVPTFLMNVPATWTSAAEALYSAELGRLGRFLVRLGGNAPTTEQLARALRAADAARAGAAAPAGDGVPLALVGGPLLAEHRALFEQVRRLGGRIVLDATPGGELTAPARVDPDAARLDPEAELVRIYFRHIPHAMRRPDDALHEWLDRELAARSVGGVLFYRHLWCDLWHAELGRLRERTALPILELDVGDEDHTLARWLGKLQAFLETRTE